MEWPTWGGSWFGSWASSWGPIEVYDERRPKASPQVKLVKFLEGKSYLGHSKSVTRSNRVNAKGTIYVPEPPLELPGHITASHSRTRSRAGKVTGSGWARPTVKKSLTVALCHIVRAQAAASTSLRTSKNLSLYGEVWVSAAAKTAPLNSRNTSNFERVRARGIRNLSNVELVAIVRATIDNKN